MPDYIWEMVCGEMADGTYHFLEGTLTVQNGWMVSWVPADRV